MDLRGTHSKHYLVQALMDGVRLRLRRLDPAIQQVRLPQYDELTGQKITPIHTRYDDMHGQRDCESAASLNRGRQDASALKKPSPISNIG